MSRTTVTVTIKKEFYTKASETKARKSSYWGVVVVRPRFNGASQISNSHNSASTEFGTRHILVTFYESCNQAFERSHQKFDETPESAKLPSWRVHGQLTSSY